MKANSNPYRVCRTCGARRHLTDMRSLPGTPFRVCLDCPDPTPRTCRLCESPSTHRVGLCHKHGERWRRWGKPPIEEWCSAYREGRLNTCEMCGKTWNGYRGSLTCSEECDMQRRRVAALARWHGKTPEDKRAINQRKPRQYKPKTPRPCIVCGVQFLAGNDAHTICSPECRRLRGAMARRKVRHKASLIRDGVAIAEINKRGAQ